MNYKLYGIVVLIFISTISGKLIQEFSPELAFEEAELTPEQILEKLQQDFRDHHTSISTCVRTLNLVPRDDVLLRENYFAQRFTDKIKSLLAKRKHSIYMIVENYFSPIKEGLGVLSVEERLRLIIKIALYILFNDTAARLPQEGQFPLVLKRLVADAMIEFSKIDSKVNAFFVMGGIDTFCKAYEHGISNYRKHNKSLNYVEPKLPYAFELDANYIAASTKNTYILSLLKEMQYPREIGYRFSNATSPVGEILLFQGKPYEASLLGFVLQPGAAKPQGTIRRRLFE